MCDKKFSNILVNSLKLESRYRAHLQTAVGHENECKNNSISLLQKQKEAQWKIAQKIGGSKASNIHNEFDICHSAILMLPAGKERWSSQALYLANFFGGANFNCFFNEIWWINDEDVLFKD